MKDHLITNVVYGQPYLDIFTNFHLRSFLDPSNLPAVKDRTHYHIFADEETAPLIGAHENWKRLKENTKTCEMSIFSWDTDENRFMQRYGVLIKMFKESVAKALKLNANLSAIVADLVCAKDFLPKIQKKMDEGHGAVFMLPPRGAWESMCNSLAKTDGALEAKELFSLTYQCLHPLWVACQWDGLNFSKIPFSLLWNSGSGLLARSFSITPIIFTPTVHMLNARQVIDVEIPAHCENPYWCENWTDAPVVGSEPVVCYYPPFAHERSSVEKVGNWAQKTLHPSQFGHLRKSLYYPDKETFHNTFSKDGLKIISQEAADLAGESGVVAQRIEQEYGGFLV